VRRAPDLAIYLRAIPLLARQPSVFVGPLLGAVAALALAALATYVTAPLGGAGASLFDFAARVFYSFAFGVAIVHADALERGLRATFDSAWEEARRKGGGIIVAAIGFWFLVMIAEYVGALFGLTGQIVLMLVAAFFLIYTIPAAAIGGLPGSLALGGSFRAVRADLLGAAILAVAFVGLFVVLPPYLVDIIGERVLLSHTEQVLLQALFEAIALGYLAFPFAKQYASLAFRA
jgi:hypothetical protein